MFTINKSAKLDLISVVKLDPYGVKANIGQFVMLRYVNIFIQNAHLF
jgi:hypothetical protein